MEMGRMLGLKKTNSYWLIKKGWFETVMVAGKMRVMVDSFEEWYQNQTHYKKVNAVESHGMQKGGFYGINYQAAEKVFSCLPIYG